MRSPSHFTIARTSSARSPIVADSRRPPLCPYPRLSYRTASKPACETAPASCARTGTPNAMPSRSSESAPPISTTAGSLPAAFAGRVSVAPRLKPAAGMTTASSPGLDVTRVREIDPATSSRMISRPCAGTLSLTSAPTLSAYSWMASGAPALSNTSS